MAENKLAGFIQRKGTAEKPQEIEQRAQPHQAEERPTAAAAAFGQAPSREPRTKALTLKLTEADYQRLRRYAFEQHTTHQDVLEAALLRYLNEEGAG